MDADPDRPSRCRIAAGGFPVQGIVRRPWRRGVLPRVLEDEPRGHRGDAPYPGDHRVPADGDDGGGLRGGMAVLYPPALSAGRARWRPPDALPLPAQQMVFRRALRCHPGAPGEMARPLPVEGRRRHHHRWLRARRRLGAGARRHPQRRQAADRVSLPLRFCDADRGGRADHLVHVRRGRPVMTTWPILSVVTFLPVVGALLIYISRGDDEAAKGNARWIALWTTLITFGVSLILVMRFDPAQPDFQFVEKAPWLANAITYHMGVDGISLPFVILTTALMPFCIVASWKSVTMRVREYMMAFLLLETLMIGTFSALDLVLFYLFFEGGLIPMFLIIGVWGGPRRVYASFKFFLYTLLGSVLMLLAIMALYWNAGTTDIPALMRHAFPLNLQKWAWLAFFASFAVKMPMWPVHTWLPDAHVEAPTAGSVILAAILLKMGGYGFLRFSLPMFPEASVDFAPLIFALSMIAVVATSLIALVQHDMKKLIAYSSVAHMAIVTVGLFAFNQQGLEGSVIMMLSHGLVSGALFLSVGVIYDRLHTREIDRYGGLAINMPYYALFFMLFTMASVGLPGTSGFIGEFLSLIGIYQVSSWVTLVCTTGIILGAAYMLYLYRRVIFGEQKNADAAAMPDLSAREWAMMVPLAAAVLWMGVYPESFIAPIRKNIAALDARLARAKLEGDARLTAGKPAAAAEHHGAPAQENASAQAVSGHEGAH